MVEGNPKGNDQEMEYGKHLKQLREAKKYSIYKLSKDSDISQGRISNLENGKNQPTIEMLKKQLCACSQQGIK